jgi:hypothetical protein
MPNSNQVPDEVQVQVAKLGPIQVFSLDTLGLGNTVTLISVFCTGPQLPGDELVQVKAGNIDESPRPVSDLWLDTELTGDSALRLRSRLAGGWYRLHRPREVWPGMGVRVFPVNTEPRHLSGWHELQWWGAATPSVPVEEWTITCDEKTHQSFGVQRLVLEGVSETVVARVRAPSEQSVSEMLCALIDRQRSSRGYPK